MCKSQEDTNKIEALLIEQYDSRNDQFGYNLISGGNNIYGSNHPNFGKKHSEETKIKRSKTMKKKCADGWIPKNMFNNDFYKYWKGKISYKRGKIFASNLERVDPNKGKKLKIINGIRTYIDKEES